MQSSLLEPTQRWREHLLLSEGVVCLVTTLLCFPCMDFNVMIFTWYHGMEETDPIPWLHAQTFWSTHFCFSWPPPALQRSSHPCPWARLLPSPPTISQLSDWLGRASTFRWWHGRWGWNGKLDQEVDVWCWKFSGVIENSTAGTEDLAQLYSTPWKA